MILEKKVKKRPLIKGTDTQFSTIRVRLHPTPEQAELFEKTFGCCRWIWNRMLADEERFYLETGKHFIPTPAKYKREASFLREVDNQALIQEHNKLSQAFRVFFRDPETFGHPRFKRKKDDKNSFTACNHVLESGPTIYATKDGLRLTKAGIVKARFPRRPQGWWKLKRVTVERTRTGKYHACILYEHQERKPEPVLPAPERTVGLKWSLSHFCVSDSGGMADPPHWLRQSQEKLTELQRKLGRMEKGSRNYRETVRKYRLLHEHIANQRRDFIHKESRRIANEWDAVCVRGDDLRKQARWSGAAGGNGFGAFRECLRYKLARQGKSLITVDRCVPTTRMCSACGWTRPEEAGETSWTCPGCGAVHDREINAARNIKERGLAQFYDRRAPLL